MIGERSHSPPDPGDLSPPCSSNGQGAPRAAPRALPMSQLSQGPLVKPSVSSTSRVTCSRFAAAAPPDLQPAGALVLSAGRGHRLLGRSTPAY